VPFRAPVGSRLRGGFSGKAPDEDCLVSQFSARRQAAMAGQPAARRTSYRRGL
jgi:hypothetical protein